VKAKETKYERYKKTNKRKMKEREREKEREKGTEI
jgi:hypothetical protein